MAKQDYILRYLAIVRKLRLSGEAGFREIADYLLRESEYHDRPLKVSKRTFVRDLNEIRELFGVDIRFNFSRGTYFIEEDHASELNNRLLESLDTINSLKLASDLTRYMFFEKRKARGTHHFHGLLHAIRNRIVLALTHQKFDSEAPRRRLLEPYALKESKGRWYLLAKDRDDRRIKTFGLDRVVDFETTPGRFDYPAGLDVDGMFRHCFGVINPGDDPPKEIILSFEPEQGKYIDSYPLHETQEVLVSTAREFRVKLLLHPTHDLVMEILSYGDRVKVIAPKSLAARVRTIHRDAATG